MPNACTMESYNTGRLHSFVPHTFSSLDPQFRLLTCSTSYSSSTTCVLMSVAMYSKMQTIFHAIVGSPCPAFDEIFPVLPRLHDVHKIISYVTCRFKLEASGSGML